MEILNRQDNFFLANLLWESRRGPGPFFPPTKSFFLAIFLALSTLILFSGCTSVFFQPDQNLYFDPQKLGYNPEPIDFRSDDGVSLSGWFFKNLSGAKPKGTIIQFHGNGENMTSHYVSLVWLVKEGYDFLTFDYRGYGRSSGEPSQEGALKDGVTALNIAWKKKRERESPLFVVYGQSLGGAIAMASVENSDLRQNIDLLVLDSTFLSYKDMAQTKLADHILTWPFSPLGQILVSDAHGPKKNVSLLTMPKLVIHDESDPVVDFEEGKALHQKLPEPKEFWTLNQNRHVGIFTLDNLKWREKFVGALAQLHPHSPDL